MKALRFTAISILLFTGINALVAGFLFMIDPSGATIGMDTSYLRFSPFSSFFIPGIVLFVVNGILNILAALAAIKQNKGYPVWILLQGLLLVGWIVVQVLMVKDINALHIIMFSLGLILTVLATMLLKK